jgi:hypothetical protein
MPKQLQGLVVSAAAAAARVVVVGLRVDVVRVDVVVGLLVVVVVLLTLLYVLVVVSGTATVGLTPTVISASPLPCWPSMPMTI